MYAGPSPARRPARAEGERCRPLCDTPSWGMLVRVASLSDSGGARAPSLPGAQAGGQAQKLRFLPFGLEGPQEGSGGLAPGLVGASRWSRPCSEPRKARRGCGTLSTTCPSARGGLARGWPGVGPRCTPGRERSGGPCPRSPDETLLRGVASSSAH